MAGNFAGHVVAYGCAAETAVRLGHRIRGRGCVFGSTRRKGGFALSFEPFFAPLDCLPGFPCPFREQLADMQQILLVCGMPRSGTTLIGALLESNEDVEVVYEPPSLATFTALPLLAKEYLAWAEGVMASPWEKWRGLSRESALATLDNFTVGLLRTLQPRPYNPRGPDRPTSAVCIKLPSAEKDAQYWEDLLKTRKPIYLYCVREPREVYASLLRMPWGCKISPQNFLDQLERSVKGIQGVSDSSRVHFLNISHLSVNPKARMKKFEEIFSRVALTIDDKTMQFLTHWPSVNRSEDVFEASECLPAREAAAALWEFDQRYKDHRVVREAVEDMMRVTG